MEGFVWREHICDCNPVKADRFLLETLALLERMVVL